LIVLLGWAIELNQSAHQSLASVESEWGEKGGRDLLIRGVATHLLFSGAIRTNIPDQRDSERHPSGQQCDDQDFSKSFPIVIPNFISLGDVVTIPLIFTLTKRRRDKKLLM
jgi:hypothetical protein